MQGDLNPTPLGMPSPAAGMIPRVLNKLFHQLNDKFSDFSVRVSYIELYNEELRDLLADDFQAPSATAQPMGKGAHKDQQQSVLQIYDDSSKKGVTIQGLREVTVKDAPDAVALLIKGSERRQIASTKFNDHSRCVVLASVNQRLMNARSRSHTIFTLTVHTKEHGAIGDDLLKVGKLNLVDLAGAENIGRSGAKEQRAAEAGNINKSLLTLGRVITLLVEKSQHIPYRYIEKHSRRFSSELTRRQGVEADAVVARLAGRQDQDVHHCHSLAGSVQSRGDHLNARLRHTREEHQEQTGNQPAHDEEYAAQGVRRRDGPPQVRLASTSTSSYS